jgi:hypothetical protein
MYETSKNLEISSNRIAEKVIPAGTVGAVPVMSFHLLQEWERLTSEPDHEAKLVSRSLVDDEVDTGEGCRGRQDNNFGEGKSELISDLKAYVLFITEEHRRACPSLAYAKHTDVYPTLSARYLRDIFGQFNQLIDGPWLRLSDFIVKGRGGSEEVIAPARSLYALLSELCVTFILYGYDETRETLIARLNHVFIQWLRLLKELKFSFIKLAKYKLAAFAAYAKQSCTMPKSPFSEEFIKANAYAKPHFIFDRLFDRFLRKQMERQSTTTERLYYMSLVDSICRGLKKGSDRPTDEEVHQANLGTVECFASGVVQGRDWEDHNEPWFPETSFCSQIRKGGRLCFTAWESQHGITPDPEFEVLRTVDEIVPPGSTDYKPSWHRMPSLSACFENAFASGGSMLSVKSQLEDEFRKPQELHELYGAVKPGILRDHLMSDDGSFNLNSDYIEFSTNYDNLSDPNDIDLIAQTLADRFQGATYDADGVRTIRHDHHDGLPKMAVLGLKEALKIRGITKGEGLENWLLQPLQKYLAGRLLRLPCFAVTGRPLVAEDLNQIFTSMEKDFSFLSGDYDNATNKMFSHYTSLAAKRVCENLGLSEAWTTLVDYSLTRNIVCYNYIDKTTKKIVKIRKFQENAQPMGKILSFVFLCMINAAVCRKAVEVDTGNRYYRVKLKHFRGLINGDDCCFALRRFESWEHMSRTVGLENSIGKTFFSKEFIEMNSRSFVIDVSDPDYLVTASGERFHLKFKETPFINFGLAKGMVRSTSAASESVRFERFCSLGDCHSDLVKGLDFIWGPLDFMFKYYNRDLLSHHRLDGIPYYVPKHWGGLGMDPGPEPEKTLTKSVRLQLSCIKDFNLKTVHVGNAVTCLVHEKVQALMDQFCEVAGLEKVPYSSLELTNGEVVSLEDENQKVYTQLVERVWKSERPQVLKTDIDDDQPFEIPHYLSVAESQKIADKGDLQILINRHFIYKKLRINQNAWKRAFQESLHCKTRGCLPWDEIYAKRPKLYYPMIKACAVRDMRQKVTENF